MAKVNPTVPQAAQPTKAAAPSAAPGTKDEKAAKPKKEKVERVFHPALEAKANDKGKIQPTVKLKEIPADFDSKKHKPLQRKHLADESVWYELKARDFDRKAADMRQLAAEAKALGGIAKSGEAKRLLAMQKRLDELKAQIVAGGMDPEAILAAAKSAVKAKEAPATT